MNRVRTIVLVLVLGIGMYVTASAIYTVNEVEQMIITQFGKPVGEPVTSAGLKLKVPFIQDVNPIDKRVLEWDGAPSDMPHQGQALHIRRSVRTLADNGSPPVFPSATR